jgi:hypothetical protein
MGAIAQKIVLFNLAYRLAWKHVSEEQKLNPNAARRLDDAIRRQLKNGADDAVFIASEALRDIDRA